MRFSVFGALLLLAPLSAALESPGARCSAAPAARVDCYPPAPRFPNATEELCLAHGCCWQPLDNGGVPCAFDAVPLPALELCALAPPGSRLECRNPRFVPSLAVSESDCHVAGCCFDGDEGACFQPFFEGYDLVTLGKTKDGWRGTLVLRPLQRGPFANDLPVLLLHVTRETARRVRIRVTDPAFSRNEVPVFDEVEKSSRDREESMYQVNFTSHPFGIAVTRRDTNEVLFNSTPPVEHTHAFNGLVFENQFVEFSTQLGAGGRHETPLIYGLGERLAPLRLHARNNGTRYSMFAQAQPSQDHAPFTREDGGPSSGVHPLYLQVLPSGRTHGVFVRSSNAMEAVVQRDAITFRLNGGVLDLTVFAGPSPGDVIAEYTEVVGRPEMPPYWALGYHLGTMTDKTVADSMATVARMRQTSIPLESYWLGDSYMQDQMPLSLDKDRFAPDLVQDFVDDLHFNAQYLMAMQVPSVSSNTAPALEAVQTHRREQDGSQTKKDTDQLDPFEHGAELDVFVKGARGERYAEKLVAGRWSVFVDFFHPNASVYWREQQHQFRKSCLPYDGVWIERDEPSSLCDQEFAGKQSACPRDFEPARSWKLMRQSVIDERDITFDNADVEPREFVRSPDVSYPFDPFRQPFGPGQAADSGNEDAGNLNARSLPLAANHYDSMHYNLHSMYGLAQAQTTRAVLDDIIGKRTVLLSRSTFSGSGHYAGHSLDGLAATWENLRFSIAGALRMNMFGVPLAGPNFATDQGNATTELYVRWFQAASFLPLMRSYSSEDSKYPTPAHFDDDTVNILRATLLRRYSYLPYMYTLFYKAHVAGHPVIQPLGFEFPRDEHAHRAEFQYLVGPALMVSPVVEEKAISVNVYYPNASWFGIDDGRLAFDPDETQHNTASLLSPLSKLQLHIRGGHIIPTQQPQITTSLSRHGEYILIAALDSSTAHRGVHREATGELYIDDGDSLGPVKQERYSVVRFGVFQNSIKGLEFKNDVVFHGYDGPEMQVEVSALKIYGVRDGFHANSSIKATLSRNDEPVKVDYFAQSNTLVLSRLHLPIGTNFNISVSTHTPTDDGKDGSSKGEKHEEHRSDSSLKSQNGERGKGKSKSSWGGYPWGIIGTAIGLVVLATVCAVFFAWRRRQEYSTIA